MCERMAVYFGLWKQGYPLFWTSLRNITQYCVVSADSARYNKINPIPYLFEISFLSYIWVTYFARFCSTNSILHLVVIECNIASCQNLLGINHVTFSSRFNLLWKNRRLFFGRSRILPEIKERLSRNICVLIHLFGKFNNFKCTLLNYLWFYLCD